MFAATEKVNPTNTDCSSEQIQIFAPIPSCEDVIDVLDVHHESEIKSPEAGPEFVFESGHFLDISQTKLFLRLQLVVESGSAIEPGEKVCPINNIRT